MRKICVDTPYSCYPAHCLRTADRFWQDIFREAGDPIIRSTAYLPDSIYLISKQQSEYKVITFPSCLSAERISWYQQRVVGALLESPREFTLRSGFTPEISWKISIILFEGGSSAGRPIHSSLHIYSGSPDQIGIPMYASGDRVEEVLLHEIAHLVLHESAKKAGVRVDGWFDEVVAYYLGRVVEENEYWEGLKALSGPQLSEIFSVEFRPEGSTDLTKKAIFAYGLMLFLTDEDAGIGDANMRALVATTYTTPDRWEQQLFEYLGYEGSHQEKYNRLRSSFKAYIMQRLRPVTP